MTSKSKYKDALEHFNALLIKLDNGCHTLRRKALADGYMPFQHKLKQYKAHVFIYEELVGPTNGLDLHHKCEFKGCVNPEHLELLTRAEHNKKHRKIQITCKRGHEYTEENTYTNKKGFKSCIVCRRASRGLSLLLYGK